MAVAGRPPEADALDPSAGPYGWLAEDLPALRHELESCLFPLSCAVDFAQGAFRCVEGRLVVGETG